MKKNNTKSFPLLLSALIVITQLCASAHVHAQESKSAKATAERAALHNILRLQSDRDDVRKGGPIAGIVVSTVLGINVGAGLMAMAPEVDLFEDQRSSEAKTLLGVGAVVLIGGIVGVTVSSIKLRQRKQEIKNIDREIRELQIEQLRVSVAHGAPQSAALVRF